MTEIPTLTNPVYKGERCRGCNRELVFLLTAKGKREPLERLTTTIAGCDHPATILRLVAIVNGQPQSLGLKAAQDLGVTIGPTTVVHVSHFATCPERARFRRGS